MGHYIKKAAPGCFGSSIGVTFVQYFQRLGVWGIKDFLFTFAVTFVITTAVVAVCIWVWTKLRGRQRQ